MTKILHIPTGQYLYYYSITGFLTQEVEEVSYFRFETAEILCEYTVDSGEIVQYSPWHTHNHLPIGSTILRSELEIIYE